MINVGSRISYKDFTIPATTAAGYGIMVGRVVDMCGAPVGNVHPNGSSNYYIRVQSDNGQERDVYDYDILAEEASFGTTAATSNGPISVNVTPDPNVGYAVDEIKQAIIELQNQQTRTNDVMNTMARVMEDDRMHREKLEWEKEQAQMPKVKTLVEIKSDPTTDHLLLM
jgi:hypothetical protein